MTRQTFSIREDVHGNTTFPCVVWHETADKNHPKSLHGTALYAHFHDDIEIIRMDEGRGRLFINEKEYEFRAGDIVYINPHDLHMMYFEPDISVIRFSCLIFHPEFLISKPGSIVTTDYINRIITETVHCNNKLFRSDDSVYDYLSMIFFQADKAMTEKPFGYEIAVFGLLSCFIAILFSNLCFTESKAPTENKTFITNVMNYLEDHYQENITLENISQSLGYSKTYFCRLFKTHFHDIYSHFLNAFRIQKACLLINSGVTSVTDLAYRVGFSTQTYFSTVFSSMTGMPPKQYIQSKTSS